jgi:hypothetical protein
MNYILLLNVLLGTTILIGFAARYLGAVSHKRSAKDGRLRLALLSAAILYAGVILASVDKVPYGSIFKSGLILCVVFVALDTMLQKLFKSV